MRRKKQYNWEHRAIVAATLGVLLLMVALAGTGCSIPTAVIRAHDAEIQFLETEKTEVAGHYAARRLAIEASIDELWAAAEADIEEYEPEPPKPGEEPPKPLDVYAIECIKGTRAAVAVLADKILALKQTEIIALDNLMARQRLLERASTVVENSQQWPEDAVEWARELRQMLKEE